MTPETAAAIRSYTSGVLRARADYAYRMASPADRKAADDLKRALRRATDQRRCRARKKGTAA